MLHFVCFHVYTLLVLLDNNDADVLITGVSDIAIVERGRNVVSSSRDGTACLWDCGKSACLTKYAADSVINACCLHVPPPSVIDLLQPDHAPGTLLTN